jgi:endo-beta-N-acetylglucosaminidase D
MTPTIPADIERQYEGRWIAWDTDANQVVASGDSMKQVVDGAKDHVDQTSHLMWYHHIVRNDAVVVGGIW